MTQKEIFHPSLTATAHTHRPGGVDSRTHVDHEAWSVKVAGTTPPGARRRRNRSNGAAPTEFGPKIIAGVPADRADARSRSTTTSTKQIDADVVESTSRDARAATLTKRRRHVRREHEPRRRRRRRPVRAKGRPPPGTRGARLGTTLEAAAQRAESTRRRDALRRANGRSATAAGPLKLCRRAARSFQKVGDWIE